MFVGQSESRQIPVLLNKHTNILLDCGIYVHDISTKLSSLTIYFPKKFMEYWLFEYSKIIFFCLSLPSSYSVDFFLPSRIIQACFCKNRIESKKDQFAEESDIYGSNYL
jgi:hypothetical protein